LATASLHLLLQAVQRGGDPLADVLLEELLLLLLLLPLPAPTTRLLMPELLPLFEP